VGLGRYSVFGGLIFEDFGCFGVQPVGRRIDALHIPSVYLSAASLAEVAAQNFLDKRRTRNLWTRDVINLFEQIGR